MKLSEQLKLDHKSGDFGNALDGYSEKAAQLENRIAELSSRVTELEAQTQWQPIESAPTDGRFLLGVWSGVWYNPRQRFNVFEASGYKDGPSWAMKGHYRTEEGGAYKLHGWMSLPKVPEVKS